VKLLITSTQVPALYKCLMVTSTLRHCDLLKSKLAVEDVQLLESIKHLNVYCYDDRI